MHACSGLQQGSEDSIYDKGLKSRGLIVKAMVFPIVMYRCESWTIKKAAAAAAKSLQSCLTLCDSTDGSSQGSPVPGIFQARTRRGLPFPSPMQESEKCK